jgi:hypothetical protein
MDVSSAPRCKRGKFERAPGLTRFSNGRIISTVERCRLPSASVVRAKVFFPIPDHRTTHNAQRAVISIRARFDRAMCQPEHALNSLVFSNASGFAAEDKRRRRGESLPAVRTIRPVRAAQLPAEAPRMWGQQTGLSPLFTGSEHEFYRGYTR